MSPSIMEGSQGKNKSKLGRNTADQLSLWIMLSWRSYAAQAHLPRDGAAYSGMVPSMSVKTMSYITVHMPCPQLNLKLGFFSQLWQLTL